MFRGCLCALTIVGLLAGQAVTIPHAHGAVSADEQRRHDATPHVHWNSPKHSHAHSGHGHCHSGHGHVHSPNREGANSVRGRAADAQDTLPQQASLSGKEHDSDAVFVWPIQSGRRSTSSDNVEIASWHLLAAATESPTDVMRNAAPRPQTHPPDEVADASDIYLTLRMLRI